MVSDSLRQVRDVGSGVSYLSFGGHDVIFGLGEIAEADSVKVRWPNSPEQVITGIPKNSIVEIDEGSTYEIRARTGNNASSG